MPASAVCVLRQQRQSTGPARCPPARPSVPVSTRSMSTRSGVLLRLDLAGQLRRGRLRVGDLARSTSGFFCDELVDHPLGQLQVAGDVEDVERDRRVRHLRRLRGRGLDALAASAAAAARALPAGAECERCCHRGHGGRPSVCPASHAASSSLPAAYATARLPPAVADRPAASGGGPVEARTSSSVFSWCSSRSPPGAWPIVSSSRSTAARPAACRGHRHGRQRRRRHRRDLDVVDADDADLVGHGDAACRQPAERRRAPSCRCRRRSPSRRVASARSAGLDARLEFRLERPELASVPCRCALPSRGVPRSRSRFDQARAGRRGRRNALAERGKVHDRLAHAVGRFDQRRGYAGSAPIDEDERRRFRLLRELGVGMRGRDR